MSGRIPRLNFARSRMPALSDMCRITPSTASHGRDIIEVPCSVFTPSLKLGHGYGHEGGGPVIVSRRVTKSIVFDRDVEIQSGDTITWLTEDKEFVAGERSVPSTNDPFIMIMCTEI